MNDSQKMGNLLLRPQTIAYRRRTVLIEFRSQLAALAREKTLNNPDLDKREFFRNLCLTAYVDGQIADDERRVLSNIARKLDLNPSLIHEVLKGTSRYRSMSASIADSERARHQTFAFMVRVIVADQIVTPEERTLLYRYGETIGFNKDEVDNYIKFSRN